MGRAIGVFYKGEDLLEKALLPHAQLFTKLLAGNVVIVCIDVDPPCPLVPEEVVQKSPPCFIGIALLMVGLKVSRGEFSGACISPVSG